MDHDLKIFGIGLPKSGTHSIASIFEDSYRTKHEPLMRRFVQGLIQMQDGDLTPEAYRAWILNWDSDEQLQVNSSQFNLFIVDWLVDDFPNAKFILTIRDCFSWIDSMINHALNRQPGPLLKRFGDWRYQTDRFEPTEKDAILPRGKDRSFESYFFYWAWHIQTALDLVPEERLLVLRTDQISNSMAQIAKFADIPVATLNAEKSHTYKALERTGQLFEADLDYVEEKAWAHCQPLMSRYFPEIETIADAFPNLDPDTFARAGS